jgi:flavin-dependent dehydrogenase
VTAVTLGLFAFGSSRGATGSPGVPNARCGPLVGETDHVRERYDVIVVGARVAGSTLAALLGEAGLSVLLLDRARFPSTTPSTHFFRGAGMVGVLERLGVLDEVLALGCPPLTREFNYSEGSEEGVEGPPQDPGSVGYCLSVRREPLDFVLLKRACWSKGVELVDGASVIDLVWDGDRVAGVELADGRRAHARIVVGADGRHSLVAKKVSPALEHETPPYRALYYRYVSGFSGPDGSPPDAPEFSQLGDELAYIFPSDSGLTCVALSVNLETFRWLRQDFEARYAERIGMHRGIAPRVEAAGADGRLAGCGPERSHLRVPWGPGWALVGDAGMHQDPWSGLGIDMAGVHATFLAEAIVDWLRDSGDERAALGRYHERRNGHGLESYHETVRFAADLSKLEA